MLELVEPLRDLRDALHRIELSLPIDGADAATRVRTELIGQIDDYLIPRLSAIDAPLLVVFGGSTGSGKSTLTNSLVGSNVSLAGVVRPSTRTPVLVCRAEDFEWFRGGGVLPDLPRSTGAAPSGSCVHLVLTEHLPEGLALLDAPDIDSVEVANHELAAQLLGAGDAWMFVTTAARYADAVPWAYLRRARERAVAMAIVVNRIPAGAGDEVVAHLGSMLEDEGLPDVPMFRVDERAPGVGGLGDGRLPDAAVAELRQWLTGLVADERVREATIMSTVAGALDSVPPRVAVVAAALQAQEDALRRLDDLGRDEYQAALAALDDDLGNGSLLRGEVLDRWREQVGTGAFMERLQHGVGRIRDRLRSMFTGAPVDIDAARGQLQSNLEILVRNHADRAALATVSKWEAAVGGSAVLAAADRGIDRQTPGLSKRLDTELGKWQDAVFELVRDESGGKLAVARMLTLGLNGIGVAVMIAVFSHTGGVTGAEVGVAAGTAAVTQTLLTALFGEGALRDLVRTARDDLRRRLAGIFEEERRRFDRLTDAYSAGPERRALESAAAALAEAEP